MIAVKRSMPLVAAGIAALLATVGTQHLGHYLGRAQANERTLIAEIMAQPICSGAPSEANAEAALPVSVAGRNQTMPSQSR